MIEKTILNYLSAKLNPNQTSANVSTIPVLMELPDVPSSDYPEFPPSLVVIQKVGMDRTNHVSHASFAFQSYGSSLLNAAALDELVRNAIDKITETTDIGGVYLASNYEFTDTRTKRYRYQCVYEFYFVEGENNG
jgi:hypothetical protein